MKKLIAIIGWLLLLSGLAIYLYGIIFAVCFPTTAIEDGKTVVKIPEALETVTTGIGAILLTNLGAVLGISIMKPEAPIARIAFVPQTTTITIPEPVSMRQGIQIAAVLLYILTLMACGIKWVVSTFKAIPDPVVSLIPQYSKTLIGVITAYIAFVLAVNTNSNKA